MPETIQPKISIKLDTPHATDFTMHILPASRNNPNGTDGHPIVAKLAQRGGDVADQAKRLLEALMSRDEDFTQWLESNPANSTLFVNDPIAAIRQALPDLPQSLYEQMSGLSRQAATVH